MFSFGSISLVEDNWIRLKIFWTYVWGILDIYLYDSTLFTNILVPRTIHFEIHFI